MNEIPLERALSYTAGGGWGNEHNGPGLVEVRVLRGADFPAAALKQTAEMPVRFESEALASTRKLRPGDIVLETSGGTKDRPTGRTVWIDEVLIGESPQPLIPASFCRLVRIDAKIVPPRFAFYALQDLYQRGGTWEFQNQSTGLANFQFSRFRAEYALPGLPLVEQRAIANVLGALDDKIAANAKLASAIDATLAGAFTQALTSGFEQHPILDVVDITFGEAFKGAHFAQPGIGRPLIRIRDLRSQKLQVWTTEVRPRETIIHAGDIVIGMDAEFRATAWVGVDGLLNQRVCRARSSLLSNALLREAMREPLAAIENQKSATTVIHLNKSDLARTTIRIPKPEARAGFSAAYDSAYDLRVNAVTESDDLAALRDALLPELMSGRLRVKDAERAVEEAV